MKSKFLTAAILSACIGFVPALASAQSAPNLLGTWKGTSNSTVMGTGSHHQAQNKKDADVYFNHVEYTMVIDRQEGANFVGVLSSKAHKEAVLGALSSDFKRGSMVDLDGVKFFTMIDSNTMDVCYAQLVKPKIASCTLYKKQ